MTCFTVNATTIILNHFPIIIEQNSFSTEDHNPKWKLNRANWDLFNALCTGKLIPENFKESSDPLFDFTY